MMLRVKQFLLGCLFGLITTYFILITGFGIYYGFSGMVGLALVSMFMHFTPFPYLLYLTGGLIFSAFQRSVLAKPIANCGNGWLLLLWLLGS
jgi:hypothetical protein